MANEFLNDLKAGDEVLVYKYRDGYALSTVSRTTKTQIILEDNRKFRKSDGTEIGNVAWRTASLSEYSGKAKEMYLTDKVCREVRIKLKETKLTRQKAEAILKILAE